MTKSNLDKDELRTLYKRLRQSIPMSTKNREAKKCSRLIRQLISHLRAKTVHTFMPLTNEINILPAIADLLQNGLEVVVSKIHHDRKLSHYILSDLAYLEKGLFGTQHPSNGISFNGQLDVVLVPGLAFDLQGNRLGYGAGYYDMFLKNSAATRVGISFSSQISQETLPKEDHDIPMHFLVCDRIIRIESTDAP